MVRKTIDEESDRLRRSADYELKRWASWGRDRGPTWPAANILYTAFRGRGSKRTALPELPADIKPIELAVCRLPAIMRTVVICFYCNKDLSPREHAQALQISKTDFFEKLKIAQYLIAQSINIP